MANKNDGENFSTAQATPECTARSQAQLDQQAAYFCVASMAGTDPTGGAGIQADIKSISATGSYAASIITALVAQNTQGVQAILDVPAEFVQQQIESVFQDLNIKAVKIGMLHQEAVIDVVVAALKKYQPKHVVIDPVMVAKSGCALLPSTMISILKNKLLSLATLITPNLLEAEKLLGLEIKDEKSQAYAAAQLGREYHINVLVKGGHFTGEQSSDVLYLQASDTTQWFHAKRIQTKNTHGTGCSYSSAIASYLAQDYPLIAAITAAKAYLTKAIQSAATMQIGQGAGPLDHFYFLKEMNI